MKMQHIPMALLAGLSALCTSCTVYPEDGYGTFSYSTNGYSSSVAWTNASYDPNGFPIFGYSYGRPVYGYTAAGAAVFSVAALTTFCYVPRWRPAPWYHGHWHYPPRIRYVPAPPIYERGHRPHIRPQGGLSAPIHRYPSSVLGRPGLPSFNHPSNRPPAVKYTKDHKHGNHPAFGNHAGSHRPGDRPAFGNHAGSHTPGDRPAFGNHAGSHKPGDHPAFGNHAGSHTPGDRPAFGNPAGSHRPGDRPAFGNPAGSHSPGDRPAFGNHAGSHSPGNRPALGNPAGSHTPGNRPALGNPAGSHTPADRPALGNPAGGGHPGHGRKP